MWCSERRGRANQSTYDNDNSIGGCSQGGGPPWLMRVTEYACRGNPMQAKRQPRICAPRAKERRGRRRRPYSSPRISLRGRRRNVQALLHASFHQGCIRTDIWDQTLKPHYLVLFHRLHSPGGREQLYDRGEPEHINLLELRAVLAAVQWRTRSRANVRTRGLQLMDAQVVLGALANKRSSSQALAHVLTRMKTPCWGGAARTTTLRTPPPDGGRNGEFVHQGGPWSGPPAQPAQAHWQATRSRHLHTYTEPLLARMQARVPLLRPRCLGRQGRSTGSGLPPKSIH